MTYILPSNSWDPVTNKSLLFQTKHLSTMISSYKTYYVYIMASKKNGTLYTGFTDDIKRRTYEHKNNLLDKSFTSRYKIFILVYYEEHNNLNEALNREKCIKDWKRSWKLSLIEKSNPTWKDLYEDF